MGKRRGFAARHGALPGLLLGSAINGVSFKVVLDIDFIQYQNARPTSSPRSTSASAYVKEMISGVKGIVRIDKEEMMFPPTDLSPTLAHRALRRLVYALNHSHTGEIGASARPMGAGRALHKRTRPSRRAGAPKVFAGRERPQRNQPADEKL